MPKFNMSTELIIQLALAGFLLFLALSSIVSIAGAASKAQKTWHYYDPEQIEKAAEVEERMEALQFKTAVRTGYGWNDVVFSQLSEEDKKVFLPPMTEKEFNKLHGKNKK